MAVPLPPEARTFRRWLDAGDDVPPPLDRAFAADRVDPSTYRTVLRAVTWAPSIAAALHADPPAPGGAPLVAQLRALDPGDVLLGAAAIAGERAPRAIRRAIDRIVRPPRDEGAAACLARGVPAGWAPVLARREAMVGADAVRGWLEAQSSRPPLWVRVADDGVATSLAAEGFTVVHRDGSALAVVGRKGIATTAAYREGRLEVQDLASQRCAELAQPPPGGTAWDVCAGRGGKTLVLARALGGRGAVHATDVDTGKLATLRTRVRRAGLADGVRVHAWDGQHPPAFGPEVRRGFDVVLVDAPCSASGTWRRNPDAKLRTDPTALATYPPLQERLLTLAFAHVRPGGTVVYVTCSIAAEENEDVVAHVAGATGASVVRAERFGPPTSDSDSLFAAVLTAAR